MIISTAERKPGEPSPSLAAAVRALVDKYGLRVLVDCSPNSVDETLLRTKRAAVFEIQPMDKDMIFSLPQLNEPFQLFGRTKLAGVAFVVLGGVPSDYEELWFDYEPRSKEGQDEEKLLGELLCRKVFDAIEIVAQRIPC